VIHVLLLEPFEDILRSAMTVRVILAFDLIDEDLGDAFSSHLSVVVTSEVVGCNPCDEVFDIYWRSIDNAVAIGANVLLQLVKVEASQSVHNLLGDSEIVLSQINIPVFIISLRVEDLISDGMCEIIDIVIGLVCLKCDCSRCVCEHCG
jgi:hypothetical protein